MNADPSRGWQTIFFRNRYLLVLTILVSLACGWFGMTSLQRFEDPRIVNRYPIIITPVPGASAKRIEALVTEKLEEQLQEVSEIKKMTSTSLAGVSIIVIELLEAVDKYTNEEVFAKIRDKMEEASREFPPGAGAPRFDDKRDPAAFTFIVGLTWNRESAPQLGILNRLAEDLADRIRTVSGTEMVRLYGAPAEQITVLADHRELSALGISADDIARTIEAADSKIPAGALRGGESDVFLEVSGEVDSVERVASIPLMTGDDQTVVRVHDVAEVQRQWRDPPTEIGLVDGKRSVLVAARMGRERRGDEWTDEVVAIVDEFTAMVGDGVHIDKLFEQAEYMKDRLALLTSNMIAGALLVMVVVFLMMGWRLGLIVGLALPVVIALTVFLFQFTGDALHQMSIYGMIIALGLLIDNAIVMVDEVTKRKADGKPPLQAIYEAVNHLVWPLLASTLTTVLAFAPIILLPGGPGDFVGAIGRGVILAVVFSLLIALTVTASLAGIFAKPTPRGARPVWWRDGAGHPVLTNLYRRFLGWGLRFPVAAIALSFFLPVAGFVLARTLGNSFFPPTDRDMFEVRVWMPNDTPIEHTRKQAQAIEEEIRERPEVKRVWWLVGGSFPRVYYNLPMDQDNSPHYAHAIVKTESDRATKRIINDLQRDLNTRFPGAQILARQFRQGPPIVADVEYRIYGPSMAKLQDLGEQIRRTLQADPEVLVTQTTMPRGEPKLWLEVDEDRARVVGFALNDLAGQLEANFEGYVGGSMLEDIEELPIRVRYRDERRGNLEDIASMNFVSTGGKRWVPLAAVGGFKLHPDLGGITRYNGVRTNIIKGYTTTEALPINVAYRVLDQLDSEGARLPPGYRLEIGGTVEQEQEVRGQLFEPLPILLLLMGATLVLVFRSALLAIMLGIVGLMSVGLAVLSTWLIDFPISFNTFMGTFGLVGVALNDSIVVLAAIRADPRASLGDLDAVVEAVLGTTRHVISTTLTTIGGFLPLILIVGGDFWPSMSIVLAGGITGASILALVFIPAAYVFLRRWVTPQPSHISVPPVVVEKPPLVR